MSKTSKKLQLLTELLSEEKVLELIEQQLGQFIVVGPDEPEYGPCLWFDTSTTSSDADPVVYFVLGDHTEDTDVSVEIDNTEYAVLNADNPVLADDGKTVSINVSD